MHPELNLVSVIIPAYNAVEYLSETLASVQSQTYPYWECIVVNDGSTDDTVSLLLEWMQKDSRIRFINKINGGLSSARNKGLQEAKGQWIQFLDADDTIEPLKFERQLSELQKNISANSICYTNYQLGRFDDINSVVPAHTSVQFRTKQYLQELVARWEKSLSIPCHCFLFSSSLFFENSISFDESLPNHEDIECWTRLFSLGVEVVFVDQVLCRYRVSPKSMSSNQQRMKDGYLQVLEKLMIHFKHDSALVKLLFIRKQHVLVSYRDFGKMDVRYRLILFPQIFQYYILRIKQMFQGK